MQRPKVITRGSKRPREPLKVARKKKGLAMGDLDEWIYPLQKWSLMYSFRERVLTGVRW